MTRYLPGIEAPVCYTCGKAVGTVSARVGSIEYRLCGPCAKSWGLR